MDIYTGEIYGKQNSDKFVMYNVVKVSKSIVTLQNIDNPLSLFETTAQKLERAGYIRVSQTPYVSTRANSPKTGNPKKRKAIRKPARCPYTLDFIEARADGEKPDPGLLNALYENNRP